MSLARLERRVPPLAVTVLLAGLMSVLAVQWPAMVFAVPGHRALAVATMAAGLAVALAGVVAFRRAGTSVDPMNVRKAATLVTAGIYRVTRNPMYLGFLLVLLGVALWWAHAVAALAVPLFVLYMNRFQIEPEERWLRERYGVDFEDYCKRVRRWL